VENTHESLALPQIIDFSSHLTTLETNLSSAILDHSLDRCGCDTGSSGTIPQTQSFAYSPFDAIFDIGVCRSVADTPLQPCIESIRRGKGHNGQCHSCDSAYLFARYIYPKDTELGLMAARHLALFVWLLKAHLRDYPEDEVLRTMLPLSSDCAYVASQRKKPVALLARLRQIIADAREQNIISVAVELRMEENIKGLEDVITTTERLRASPIPPVYSFNVTRLMSLYLLCLPLALIGIEPSRTVTLFMTALVGYAMFGLDEVSHWLEQPFRLMPLYQLSKVSMLDVSDAFVAPPPPLSSRTVGQQSIATKKPAYW
jgi:Bestrophin, RFP-TM, chloride channel